MANGYAGTILYCDLSTGSAETRPLDMEFARKYIGGLGFALKLYLDLIKDNPTIDAYSPENPFVIMTGPLTGMKLSGVARWCVCSRSPQTGLLGSCNVGGSFGAHLKFSGYDGIVITGKASSPVYIHIDGGKVEVRDAGKYWGKDVYDVTDEMIEDNRGETKKSGHIFAIGPAGEKLVKFASIVHNKGHVAGRTGMGAVWGSKNLKAIYVRGSGKLQVAQSDKFEQLRSELKEMYSENAIMASISEFGTNAHMNTGLPGGDIPMKNWQIGEWDRAEELSPVGFNERILTGRKTCYGCAVACKREGEIKGGPYKFSKGPGPEYETIAAFGTMCLNPSLESISKANDICNRLGMDTISCGSTIAFAMECYEKGLIKDKDTDGLDLSWGNSEAIVALTEKIGRREGFGNVLAEGSRLAAEHIGGNAGDFLTTVKGLEAPMHDPRAAHGYGLAYAVSPRGACHMASLEYPIEGGLMYLPEYAELQEDIIATSSERKVALNILSQDFGMFFSDCAIFCNLGGTPLNATQALDLVNYVTGFDYTLEEILKLGRRIWYLRRGLANLFGSRSRDDVLPKRMRTPLSEGPVEGSVPDMEMMIEDFYRLRGISSDGIPEKGVLEELDLAELAGLLHPI
ncbi:MAG TPA: aldehyde ferredoxin oxidoreductase family protein [Desulfomonilia bacterium]|nr:aldehyde ferredoxin oxidoreductase family protein [Desulfomonilia bacterium]